MYGFSVYLSNPLDEGELVYIKSMRAAGFKGVFTSLHIPEDDATVLRSRLKQLSEICAALDLDLMADISTDGFARLQIDYTDVAAVRTLGLAGMRLDYGFTMAEIAALTHVLPIALNASTLTLADLQALRDAGADLTHIEAWHNYYPRPETGLDAAWYAEKNAWLQQQGLKTMGFVAGDGQRRLPLGAGLPTLEAHRNLNPLAAAIDLAALATDKVYVGDNTLRPETQAQFARFIQDDVLQLRTTEPLPAPLYNRIWHNRSDVARDVVRLEEARPLQLLSTVPTSECPRMQGSVTVDNSAYGRYAGEIQITKHDLPADTRVNVLGTLDTASQALLPFVGAHQALEFIV